MVAAQIKKTSLIYCLLVASILLSGCSDKAGYFLSSFAHPLPPSSITFEDSGKSLYYTYAVGEEDKVDTYLFFFADSGCSGLRYYLRQYLKGLQGNIKVFALQKRFVSHDTTGVFGCSENFDAYNYFNQWISDYGYFVRHILATSQKKPKKVVFFGVSEGAWPAAAVAAKNPGVTLLAIIGHGGMKMRDNLKLLVKKGDVKTDKTDADIEAVYQGIFRDPNNTSKHFLGQTYKYWASVLDIDPLEYLLRLRIPVVVAMGEKDKSVPVEFTFNDVLDFLKKTKSDKLPITCVAIEKNECIGTVSLFINDLTTRTDLTPWLAALVVRQDHRNRGIGGKLINHALNEAKTLGHQKVFLKTENRGRFYGKRGWKYIGKGIDKHGQESDLYEYVIQDKSG